MKEIIIIARRNHFDVNLVDRRKFAELFRLNIILEHLKIVVKK